MRVMMFVDGENLTCRFQAMEKEGRRRTGVTHEPNSFVWHPNLVGYANKHSLLRVCYYTSVIGGEPAPTELREKLSKIQWFTKTDWGNLVPMVFAKKAREDRSRHVDIAITIDVMRHCFLNHIDALWLVSGDRDFLPLIKEVMQHGKRVFVTALSSGLHPEIPRVVDGFHLLDRDFFHKVVEAK